MRRFVDFFFSHYLNKESIKWRTKRHFCCSLLSHSQEEPVEFEDVKRKSDEIDKKILELLREKLRIYEEYDKVQEWKKTHRPAGWV